MDRFVDDDDDELLTTNALLLCFGSNLLAIHEHVGCVVFHRRS